MTRLLIGPWALGAVCALILGVLFNFLLIDVPGAPAWRVSTDTWQLPHSARPAIKTIDAEWEKNVPWPAPPPPPEAAALATAAPEGPAPVPVGVAKSRGTPRAIFTVPGEGNVLLRTGEPLPGGGRVLRISGLSVEWMDAKGQRQQREMFNTYQVQEETALPPPPAKRGRR